MYADGMPQIIKDNIGSGNGVDFWTICGTANCPSAAHPGELHPLKGLSVTFRTLAVSVAAAIRSRGVGPT
jgi:hypothetical protein